MKIVVGLGNIGQKYSKNRHNTGFILIDKLAYNKDCSWSEDKKFNAEICKPNNDLLFVKPSTFMNRSGESVSRVMSFYKDITAEDLYVIHDDVDLEFGEVKLQKGRSSAGHNGVQDIIDKLGTNEFWRFRVGVGRPDNPKIETENWVLTNFTEEEFNRLQGEIFDTFIELFDN